MGALFEAVLELVESGDVYLLLLPIYVVLIAGDRLAHALRAKRPYNNRDAAANLFITGVYLAMDVVIGGILPLAAVVLLYDHARLWTLGDSGLAWVVAFLLYDLTWYLDHRVAHRVGFFWAMHHVHHSSNEYNMTVASRGFILDNTLLSRPLFYVLPILGVSPLQFLAIKIVTNVWGIAQHTSMVGKLGWLDKILATPSNHRVHHGSDPKYLDRNYGEVLILWDHLFGSYQAEEETPTYGVTDKLESYNPVTIEIAGWRWLSQKMARLQGWDKVRCLVMPPGWEPASRPE